jgi:toxin-antitoxin system, antitoxin component, xre family
MPAQWTGDVLAKMHIEKITSKRLAEHLGYSKEYVSMVLNGKREPKYAELIFRKGLDELIAAKNCSQKREGGGENMNVKVELQGLEEMNALLKENRRLTDELMDNLRGLQRACMLINVREKENQPEAATND